VARWQLVQARTHPGLLPSDPRTHQATVLVAADPVGWRYPLGAAQEEPQAEVHPTALAAAAAAARRTPRTAHPGGPSQAQPWVAARARRRLRRWVSTLGGP
jgi:hypothetical protein